MAERRPTVKLRICQPEKMRKEYVWSIVWELISLPTFDYEDRMTIMLCMDVERWSYVFWAVLLARSDDQNRWLSTAICYRIFILSGESLFQEVVNVTGNWGRLYICFILFFFSHNFSGIRLVIFVGFTHYVAHVIDIHLLYMIFFLFHSIRSYFSIYIMILFYHSNMGMESWKIRSTDTNMRVRGYFRDKGR